MDIAEIRTKYPQYNDMSDQQIADGLHKKFYSDMPTDEFYKKINFNQQPGFMSGVVAGAENLGVRAVKGLWNQVAEIPKGIANIPVDMISMFHAMGNEEDLEREQEEGAPPPGYVTAQTKLPEGSASGFEQTMRQAAEPAANIIPSANIAPPKNIGERVTDVGTGLVGFIGKLWLTRKALGIPELTLPKAATHAEKVAAIMENLPSEMAAWSGASIASGDKPQNGAMMALALGGLGTIPNKTIRLMSESGLFAGLAAAQGGDPTDITIQALLPGALRLVQMSPTWIKSQGDISPKDAPKVAAEIHDALMDQMDERTRMMQESQAEAEIPTTKGFTDEELRRRVPAGSEAQGVPPEDLNIEGRQTTDRMSQADIDRDQQRVKTIDALQKEHANLWRQLQEGVNQRGVDASARSLFDRIAAVRNELINLTGDADYPHEPPRITVARQMRAGGVPDPRIKSPAIQMKDGTIYEGENHPTIRKENKGASKGKAGFTTTDGRFVNRTEGAEIAKAAGQTTEEFGDKKLLRSEFLDKGKLPGGKQSGAVAIPEPVAESMESTIERDIKPLLQKGKSIVEGIQSIILPGTLKTGKEEARKFRESLGEMEAKNRRAAAQLETAGKFMGKQAPQFNYDFIDAYEHGTPMQDPVLNELAQKLHEMDLKQRNELIASGRLHDFIENHFPHMWKNLATKEQLALSKRPLAGSRAAIKSRKIPYFRDGMRWRVYDKEGFVESFATEAEANQRAGTVEEGGVYPPLTPLTDNAVEAFLVRTYDTNKMLMADKHFKQAKAEGRATFAALGTRPTAGQVVINDPIGRVYQYSKEAGGMVYRGNWYMDAERARIFNNYTSAGLHGQPLYDMIRTAGNALNQFQLGMSGFHFCFVSLDTMIGGFELGLRKSLTPGFRAEGLSDMLHSWAVGFNQAKAVSDGKKLRDEYLKPIDQQDPFMRPLVKALEESSAPISQDPVYKTDTQGGIKNAIKDIKAEFKEKNYIGAGARAGVKLPMIAAMRTVEAISSPLMDYYVPLAKLGVNSWNFKFILEQSQRENWSHDKTVARLQEAADSIDNRMGQLKYDNIFWNKTFKDILLAAVRSTGWRFGTAREIIGGVKDLTKIVTEGRLTPRSAYTISLPIMTGVVGATVQYLMSGKMPGQDEDASESWKDFYFPRTGRKMPNGKWERIVIPSYMKDVIASHIEGPVKYLTNAAHPLLTTLSEIYRNQDYMGNQLVDKQASLPEKAWEASKDVAKQFEPFSMRNWQTTQEHGEKGVAPIIRSGLGAMSAPRYVTDTPFETQVQKVLSDIPKKTMSPQEAKKAKLVSNYANQWRMAKQSDNPGEELDKVRKSMADDIRSGNMTTEDRMKVAKQTKELPIDYQIKQRLSAADLVRIWPKADDEEKKKYLPVLRDKILRLAKNKPDEYKEIRTKALAILHGEQ